MSEQEAKVHSLFKQLEAGFKQLERVNDDAKGEKMLKDLVNIIKDVKGCANSTAFDKDIQIAHGAPRAVKEYEREAKVDGVDAAEIKSTRSEMVNTVNKYVSLKKEYSSRAHARAEALAIQAGPSRSGLLREDARHDAQDHKMKWHFDRLRKLSSKHVMGDGHVFIDSAGVLADMLDQEIMQAGRSRMKETEATLDRAVRVVHDTESVGTQAASKLKSQTDQMKKIVDDLEEIDMTMDRASKVMRDITRGLLTDKCIMCLMFLVVAGIITAVALKIADVDGDGESNEFLPGPEPYYV